MSTASRWLLLAAVLCSTALAQSKVAPDDYAQAIAEMNRALTERDFEAALAAIEQADKLLPPTPRTLSMRGAIALERKDWLEAARCLSLALKLDAKYYPARFNMAESLFLQGKYLESREIFQTMLEENPRDELLRFRVFLSHLVEKDDATARAELAKLKFPGDTPAFYYANAAWEFAHSNKDEGQAWVTRGNWAFKNPAKTENFVEALVQLGWIERPVREKHP